ncbi:MAG: Bax inhibitor-1 family protein [Planctomycetaceae bacterium]|nr:Bax inhibitor-1 family protein [Planctomycetaceae bacterium]
MSQSQYNKDFYAPTDLFAAAADAQERSTFITRTYFYLLGAICAIVGIEVVLFNTVDTLAITGLMTGGHLWLIVIGLFMFVSWIANSWAMNATSSAVQHAGLAIYIVAASVILMPLLCIALSLGAEGMQIIKSAGLATGGLFALMTLAVFITRQDFSFLRTFLVFGSFAALGFIIFAIISGFSIGPIFMYAMIALMCGYILYDTSNIMHHYRTTQHVAASLALLASVVMLFWYVLQLFLASSRD